MSKDLVNALKKLLTIVQSAAPCFGMAADVCAQLAQFIGAHVLLTDGHGKLVTQTSDGFRLRESIDGLYIDSKTADRLYEIGVLTQIQMPAEKFPNFISDEHSIGRYGLVLPLNLGTERIATITAYGERSFEDVDIALLEAAGAVIVLILGSIYSSESNLKRRDTEAVKLALGTLSYSELAAILHVFREIDREGLIVATRIADKMRIARSVIVNALRKLEGAGIIETRSLGVKGTHIKVLRDALLEELFKIRD